MGRLGRMFENFLYRTYWNLDTLRRVPDIYQKVGALCHFEYLEEDEFKAKQLELLCNLLHYAYKTSPFYKHLLDTAHVLPADIRSFGDFANLPVLRKRDIQQHLPEMIRAGACAKDLIKDATGGSTGEPLIFYHDPATRRWSEAFDVYVKAWWGLRPWCKKALLWGADVDAPAHSRLQGTLNSLSRSVFLNSFGMDDTKMKLYAQFLNQWKPEYIQGYASSLFLFSRYLKSNSISLHRPKAIRSSAETLLPYQRNSIREAIGDNLYD